MASRSMSKRGHIYWTNMGVPNLNDGSIERVDLDGRNRTDDRSPRAARSRRNSSSSTRRTASCTGATAKGCASCARTSTARRWRPSWRRARATRDRPRPDEMVRRHRRRCRARTDLLDAKRPGRRGTGPHPSREHRDPGRAERVQSHRHRSAVRRPARADRSGARSQESPPVLDRPRRPAARQHGQPRPDGRGFRDARRPRRFCSPT